jgi:hypothetical protein
MLTETQKTAVNESQVEACHKSKFNYNSDRRPTLTLVSESGKRGLTLVLSKALTTSLVF